MAGFCNSIPSGFFVFLSAASFCSFASSQDMYTETPPQWYYIRAGNLGDLRQTDWQGAYSSKAYDFPGEFRSTLANLDVTSYNGVWVETSSNSWDETSRAYIHSGLSQRYCISSLYLELKYFSHHASGYVYPCQRASAEDGHCYLRTPTSIRWHHDIYSLSKYGNDEIKVEMKVMKDGYILFDFITIYVYGTVKQDENDICEYEMTTEWPSSTEESTTTEITGSTEFTTTDFTASTEFTTTDDTTTTETAEDITTEEWSTGSTTEDDGITMTTTEEIDLTTPFQSTQEDFITTDNPSTTPQPVPPKSGDPCDPHNCRHSGYCFSFLRCDKTTRKWIQEECGDRLLWNPLNPNTTEQIHGGNCDILDNIPMEIKHKYKMDPDCLGCFWKELGECERDYLYQPPDQEYRNVLRLRCSSQLVFSERKNTCQNCADVIRSNGSRCCGNSKF